ncbi:integrase catalytic domain-containing protein [Trichonephila clavipes]|nr:integrase catalytic domain-containing protein [Trichonephila clavipes]
MLKRFTSRQGKCSKIYTDNATNFVGANSILKKFHNLINFPDENLAKYFVSENIDWKFIPPKSPHFGGLWEAAVKSVKHHLKRAIGNLHFTFEEFETLSIMIQVEGILNSRPLTLLSSDTDNFDVLTPGHFLIGRSITSIPEPNLIDVNENRLRRWEKITKVVQGTWKKWKSDYLNTLQARSKWITEKNYLMIGQMVLIKEDFLPINTWPLGRILEVYHGSDGKVRVVKVKTQSGEFKRAISIKQLLSQLILSKLCVYVCGMQPKAKHSLRAQAQKIKTKTCELLRKARDNARGARAGVTFCISLSNLSTFLINFC